MPTVLIESIEQWLDVRKSLDKKSVGLVPTMGKLHAGHISLVKRSIAENDITVLSCFVNPTQFNNEDDFESYPRVVQQDFTLCEAEGVDYFFAPDYEAMYPDDYRYRVSEKELSTIMEGEYRPGHFDGMLTIVLKLLLLIKADKAYFGQKDYQQLQLIQGMVAAFFIDTDIVPCPTIREASGLAMSSRNSLLNEEQYAISHYLHQYLNSDRSCGEIATTLQSQGFDIEYIREHKGRRFAAVRLGDVRLIDNVEV